MPYHIMQGDEQIMKKTMATHTPFEMCIHGLCLIKQVKYTASDI